MRSVYNFWCISFVSSEFLKHVHDLPSESRKNNFTGLKNTQNCLFSSHLLFRQLWTEVLGHFRVPGAFSNAHRSNTPFTPQTMLDECIHNFIRVSTLYRVWGGRTARKFRKGCTVQREPRNDRKIRILQYCPKDFCPGLQLFSDGSNKAPVPRKLFLSNEVTIF